VKTIDQYLSRLSDDKRKALTKLRKDIKAAAPRAEECISYQIPAFRLDGRMLVWFHAAAKHCSFFPGAHPIRACKKALTKYSTSKGTIRFSPDKPLPTLLVKKLVKARIAERG
jgi:uncharacterized protein YdhG (YjbR/CyaY superfamily)